MRVPTRGRLGAATGCGDPLRLARTVHSLGEPRASEKRLAPTHSLSNYSKWKEKGQPPPNHGSRGPGGSGPSGSLLGSWLSRLSGAQWGIQRWGGAAFARPQWPSGSGGRAGRDRARPRPERRVRSAPPSSAVARRGPGRVDDRFEPRARRATADEKPSKINGLAKVKKIGRAEARPST